MKVATGVLLGAALPVCALLAFAGGNLRERHVAAVPLIALAAWMAASMFIDAEQRPRRHTAAGKALVGALVVSSLALALVRAIV